MDTQQALDALTDHMAIYHRCAERLNLSSPAGTSAAAAPRPNSKLEGNNTRHRVVQWMSGLTIGQRKAVLTVVDKPWVSLLLQMQQKLSTHGPGNFIILPDVPSLDGSAKPGLCYRKANGLLARLSSQELAADTLIRGVQIFSSEDGEKRPITASGVTAFDSMTITDKLVENLERFLALMDEVSYGLFLVHPLESVASPWEETPWLQVQGYYSMAAFIANKLEIAIWSSWICSGVGKRPSRGGVRGSKVSEPVKNNSSMVRVANVSGTATIAQSIYRRRQGCLDWWNEVGSNVKEKTVKVALAAATKSSAENAKQHSKNIVETRDMFGECLELGTIRGRTVRKRTLSDTECELQGRHLIHDAIVSSVLPVLSGLRALKEVAESGILSASTSSHRLESKSLFYSTLNSVDTMPDRVKRKARDVLTRVMADAIELELLGGEDGTKLQGCGGSGKSGEVKASKERKKRRKRRSTQKVLPQDREDSGVKSKKQQGYKSKAHKETKAHHPNSGESLDYHHQNGNRHETRTPLKPSKLHTSSSRGIACFEDVDVATCGQEGEVCNEVDKSNILKVSQGAVKVPACVPMPISGGEVDNTAAGGNAQLQKQTKECNVLSPVEVKELSLSQFKAGEFESKSSRMGMKNGNFYFEARTDLGNLSEESRVSLAPLMLQFGTLDLGMADNTEDVTMSDHALHLGVDTPQGFNQDPQTPLHSSDIESVKKASGDDGNAAEMSVKAQRTDQECGRSLESSAADSLVVENGVPTKTLQSDVVPIANVANGIACPTTPGFSFNEEPLLVHNLKPVPLRTQQTAPSFALFYSHEWPGYSQVRVSGGRVQPTATERLHLDVIHDWPKRMGGSPVALTNRSSLPQPAPVSLEWPPFVQSGYSLTPLVEYSNLKESGVLAFSPFSSSAFPSCAPPTNWPNGHGREGGHAPDCDDRGTDDTDLEVLEPYAGDFDDFDGYMVSEEEVEQRSKDVNQVNVEDFNQIFGGGVLYWNSADYAGMGYSRPGSMSSDDSSWARREADLSVVLDDIVGLHPLPGPYRSKGSTSSNLSNISPSQSSSSLPLSFEHMSATQVGQRRCLSRSVGNDFPGNFVAATDDVQAAGPTVGTTIGVVDGMMSDGFMPRLRPIVVVRDPGLSRTRVKNEARSPHIGTRVTGDGLGNQRRRPSPPVMRHAPPPPPPSPVAGLKRRKGWMSARSGSSSPRHWGLTSRWNKEEMDGLEAQLMNRTSDGVVGNGQRRAYLTSTPPVRPLSGALLREHLVAPFALDQEHMPDTALPMQSSVLYNKNPTLHLAISLLHTALHKEIESFCAQVANEKRMRMPFINTAVKKVAHSLQVLWPRSRTKIFGSNATGLALPSSDVDLVVSLPPVRKAREPIKQAGILEGRIDGIKETCLLHAARNLETQDWVEVLQVIEHTMVPIIRLTAHILPHQCELGDSKPVKVLGEKEKGKASSPVAENWKGAEVLMTCEGPAEDVVSQVKGPWGSEADREFVRLDISFEAPANTGLRTAELVRELMGQFPPITPLALLLKQFLADRSLDHPYKGGLSSYCQVLLITRFLQHQQHLGRPPSSQSLGSLFMDFLHFFGCVFDPRRMCVRIRAGGMYVSRDRGLSIDPLYIEDPFDFENNVGSTCFRIQQIVKAFADAYASLEKELFEGSLDGTKSGESFTLLQKILPSMAGK
ncbi:unnamed protein product [Sphagnum jensenii]|uniref:Polymerase nucleotidyl transferase domain-containing protein n=1 Tax=Sphagnum jensenii TaxID=128206 RepID=A0ABP1AX22_9BRYO